MVNLRFPNMKGANEREQLKEMQSYLYQLVEQLQFALNTIEISQNNSSPASSHTPVRIIQSAPVTSMNNQSSFQTADFIIEAGEKNGWTYKKWESGTFEMFGRFTVISTVVGTAYGNLYYSEQFAIPAPFTCSYAVVAGTTTSWFIPITGGLANNDDPNNYIGFRLFSPTAFEVGQESIVSLHVTGEYM